MMDYLFYIAILIPVLLYFLGNKLPIKLKWYLSLIVPIFIIITRFGIGTDYFSYEYIYNNLNYSSLEVFLSNPLNIEYGFALLMIIPRSLGLPYHFFAVILNLVMFSFFTLWIYDSSEDVLLSLILFLSMFFLIWNLSAFRQGLVLAIGTYFLFNKKKDYKPITRIILIILLASFHISALFYYILLIFKKVNWNQRKILMLFIASLIVAFLPIYKIVPYLTFFPGSAKLISYLGEPTTVFNFSGIARILMFTLVFAFYKVKNDKFNRSLIDAFLLGNAMFFLVKFSDIVAARLSIFTFILASVIFVNIYVSLGFEKVMKLVTSFGIVLSAFMFFQKDVRAYQTEVGLINRSPLLKYTSINDVDRTQYYERYNNLTHQRELCLIRRDEFYDRYVYTTDDYEANDVLFSVKYQGKYGILNQDQEWIINPTFNEKIPVQDQIVIMDGLYKDLSNQDTDQYNLAERFEESKRLDASFLSKEPINNGMTFKELHQTARRLVLQPHLIKQAIITYTPGEILTYTAQFSYLSYPSYIYMNADQRPLVNQVYPNFSRFDRRGIMNVKGYCGMETFDIKGNMLWME